MGSFAVATILGLASKYGVDALVDSIAFFRRRSREKNEKMRREVMQEFLTDSLKEGVAIDP